MLLKNAGGQLPLDGAALKSIAVIGSHADTSVLSGGGSAQVDPPGGGPRTPWGGAVWFPSSPLKAICAKAPKAKVVYNEGTDPAAAAAVAKASDVAIVFVNQPTSEGRDVPTLTLPDNQDKLVSAVAAANPHTIVVLETGGPAAMPWIGQASAAIEIWYPGIRGGEALANILFGDVNPSGKLPVSIAGSDADLPHPAVPGLDLSLRAAARAGRAQADAGFRHRLHRRAEGRLQVVRRGGQGALVRVRAWALLHHLRVFGSEGGDGQRVVHRAQYGKREGAEIVQVYAGCRRPPRAAQAPGGVG